VIVLYLLSLHQLESESSTPSRKVIGVVTCKVGEGKDL
jgi:hypothetical protein